MIPRLSRSIKLNLYRILLFFNTFASSVLQKALREFLTTSSFMGQQSPVLSMMETRLHCNVPFCPPRETNRVPHSTVFIGSGLEKINLFQASSPSAERNPMSVTVKAACITSQRTSAPTTWGPTTALWPPVGRFYLEMESGWKLFMVCLYLFWFDFFFSLFKF